MVEARPLVCEVPVPVIVPDVADNVVALCGEVDKLKEAIDVLVCLLKVEETEEVEMVGGVMDEEWEISDEDRTEVDVVLEVTDDTNVVLFREVVKEVVLLVFDVVWLLLVLV